MVEASNKKWLITANVVVKEDAPDFLECIKLGLSPNHAYGILRAVKVQVDGKQKYLI